MFLVGERWVGDGERLLHIDPKFLWPQQHFFLILLVCTTMDPEGPSPLSGAGSHSGILSPTRTAAWTSTDSNSNWLKPSVAPGYIIVWHPPTSCGRTHLPRIQPCPQVKVIFQHPRPDAPVSTVPLPTHTGASLDWRLGRGSICNTCLKTNNGGYDLIPLSNMWSV